MIVIVIYRFTFHVQGNVKKSTSCEKFRNKNSFLLHHMACTHSFDGQKMEFGVGSGRCATRCKFSHCRPKKKQNIAIEYAETFGILFYYYDNKNGSTEQKPSINAQRQFLME